MSKTQDNGFIYTEQCDGCARQCLLGITTEHSRSVLPVVGDRVVSAFIGPNNRLIIPSDVIREHNLRHGIAAEDTAKILARAAANMCGLNTKQR